MLQKSEFPVMKKERKLQWMKVLTDPNIKQAFGLFVDNSGENLRVCVNGGLCIARCLLEGHEYDDSKLFLKIHKKRGYIFSKEMLEWSGMTDQFQDALQYLNDDRKFSLRQLAHWLDKNIRAYD